MTTTKRTYTPGPWTVEHSDVEATHPFIVITEPHGDAPDLSVAIVEYGGNNYDPSTLAQDRAKAMANARLMAKAPELYEMLRTLVYAPEIHSEDIAQARALLTAIEGEE